MISKEQYEMMAKVGPGTPTGELLRRYWHPIGVAAELEGKGRYGLPKTKFIKILDEELCLFRDDKGRYGLLRNNCPHRGASLAYGFVEDGGIRCPYHGYLFDVEGECMELPDDPEGETRRHGLRTKAYPVEKLAGLLFAYMGPAEKKPLLPRWDVLVREDGTRKIHVREVLKCTWLNAEENSVDPVHTRWVHARVAKLKGLSGGGYYARQITKIEFKEVRGPVWAGILKIRTYGGDRPELEIGHPLLFPNMLMAPEGKNHVLHWRVPIDDTNTQIFNIAFTPSENGKKVKQTENPPVEYISSKDETGEYHMNTFHSQDGMAWETQGAQGEWRLYEQLGCIDSGIEAYRKMLWEQIEIVKNGGEPIGLIRDPKKNKIIDFKISTGQSRFSRAEEKMALG